MSLDLQSEAQLWIGTFEREISSWLRRFADDVEVGIDIGAGHGEYALFLLLRTNAKRVVAFEPDLATVALFRRNLSLNDQIESERFKIVTEPAGSGLNEVSLDSFNISSHGPCLLKIDVEGHESSVLRSASDFLRKNEVRLIIETHSESEERECHAILREADFETRVVGQGWWRTFLPENRPILHNQWLVAWNQNPSMKAGS